MHVLRGVICRVWLFACGVHYVYVNVIEEKRRHFVLVGCGN